MPAENMCALICGLKNWSLDIVKKSAVNKNKWRLIHRYLGFFLAGIMAVYAISGITLIFRDTPFLKKEIRFEKILTPGLNAEAVGKEIKQKSLEFTSVLNSVSTFKNGSYNAQTGEVKYSKTELPFFIKKLTNLHKANTGDPLFFLNIFFGLSLLFFVISSFWMFRPKSSVFRKGMYWTIGGIVFTFLILYYNWQKRWLNLWEFLHAGTAFYSISIVRIPVDKTDLRIMKKLRKIVKHFWK